MKKADIQRQIDRLIESSLNSHSRVSIAPPLSPKFSRNWYQAEFDDRHYFEVDAWCEQHFGPHPKNPDAWSRWWHKFEDSILFRDEKDYVLFVLRWS